MATLAAPVATPAPAAPAALDAAAVAAVRAGDAQRFRELVERHERRVYAVAWSRLGDAALAEDAAQEAFIRAYRYLPLLGDGGKFAAWISTIARHAAISLGLRHRRELDKRARWALEQPVAEAPAAAGADSECPPHTLRAALAALPAAHRECLTLYYLEGRDGAAAAAALGIAEGALRVRLHRARAALRAQLETRLGDSLELLRPVHSLAAPVMAALLVSPGGKIGGAAGAGGGALALAGKVLPAGFVFLAIQLVAFIPGLLFQGWIAREERRNYRDADGFRPRLHRRMYRTFFWMFPATFLVIWLAQQLMQSAWGILGMFLATGSFSLGLAAVSARQFTINRGRQARGQFWYCLSMAAVMLGAGLGWLPMAAVMPGILLCTVFLVYHLRDRTAQLRLDLNLFLRAAQNLLPPAAGAPPPASAACRPSALRAFARFLGERFLVVNFRWSDDGLVLRLPVVQPDMAENFRALMFPVRATDSQLRLGYDGGVVASLGARDRRHLAVLEPAHVPDPAALERGVRDAVAEAWARFRAGDAPGAERALGQTAEADIFLTPPPRARSLRVTYWLLAAGVALALLSSLGFYLSEKFRPPPPPPAPYVVPPSGR